MELGQRSLTKREEKGEMLLTRYHSLAMRKTGDRRKRSAEGEREEKVGQLGGK